jgi:putative aldouronate transport system substrate-binding protein
MKSLRVRKSLAITMAIIFSLFTACTSINNDLKSKENTYENNNDESTDKPSWALDTTPIKLNWYVNANWYNKIWDSKVTLFDKTVTEKTGVELNIITPAGGENEKLMSMAISGNLPDILTIDNWNNITERMIKAGDFIPLNKLAEQYAPELLQSTPESMKQWFTREDGNWYGITNYFIAPEWLTEDTRIENGNGFIARKDIMDKLNIKPEDFNTQAGTIEALKKVRDRNISVEGKSVTPIFIQMNDWVLARMWGIHWEDSKGNWQDYITHPKYLEIYKFINRLWREGLISKENFTTWAGEKIREGTCFAYLGNTDDVKQPILDLYDSKQNGVYTAVGPIHAKDGAEPLYDQAGTGWMSTYISKECQNPERAIRLLAFLSSDEGQMLSWYGVEGISYKLENGKVKYTNAYLNMKKDDREMADKVYGINSFWMLSQSLFYQRLINVEALPGNEKSYLNILNYFSKYAVRTPETMGANPGQGTPEVGLNERIRDYWSNQVRSMILAASENEVEKIYKESIKYIKDIGYEKVYKASNERFLELKGKQEK